MNCIQKKKKQSFEKKIQNWAFQTYHVYFIASSGFSMKKHSEKCLQNIFQILFDDEKKTFWLFFRIQNNSQTSFNVLKFQINRTESVSSL